MKLSKSLILAGTALTSLLASHVAFAQSTATQTVEEPKEIVVKGVKAVGEIKRESGPKAKATIDQSTISKSTAGQTILDTLNMVPGLNYTNNDAFGSSGGNLVMRGLDGARVSLTFDGTQLNDSGNYAIYGNQQMEPELICSASVQTGATDVDSMTASATGGTINYSTCKPTDTMSGVVKLSAGDENFQNGFVRFDSGKFGPFGTKFFLAVTAQSYDTWSREPALDPDINAHLQKTQYNARIYQDVGDKGSFMSLAFHWNENRNHFQFGPSKPQINCVTDTTIGGNVNNVPPNCGYDYNSINGGNINPSDTGNIRGQSKWVVTDKLTITVDPSYQYVLANGGGNSTLAENSLQLRGALYATVPYVDINGNGVNNSSPAVTIYRPNTTNTNRFSLNTSAIYKLTETQTIRVGASFDRARHRQTGEATLVDVNQAPINVFGGKNDKSIRIKTADGTHWRRRDRFSKADVDVLSLEYRGRFIDEKLFVSLGVRQQKLERELNQYCYSPLNGTGSTAPYCSTQPVTATVVMSDGNKIVTLGGATTQYFAPYKSTVDFTKTLPNVGVTWNFSSAHQVFATYAESMSSPRTDSYYGVTLRTPTVSSTGAALTGAALTAAQVANAMDVANPSPETSNTIELGYRYRASNLNATATFFTATDQDRIVSAFDRDSGSSIDRNVGEVKRKGFEASVAYSPVEELSLTGGFTYTDTEVQSDLEFGTSPVTGATRYLPTKGKQLAEMPKYMFNMGVNFTPTDKLTINLTGKYVGDRFTTDVNDDVAPHYSVWDGSVRYDLTGLPMTKSGTYVQLNVRNLFDKEYLGSFSSQNNALPYQDGLGAVVGGVPTPKSGTFPFMNVGAPRTVVLTLRTQF